MDTYENKFDRVRLLQDADGDNPQCLICGRITRENAAFCSESCTKKAMNRPSPIQHMVREASKGSPFYNHARIVDGGMWPGQNHKIKNVKRLKDWRNSFGPGG